MAKVDDKNMVFLSFFLLHLTFSAGAAEPPDCQRQYSRLSENLVGAWARTKELANGFVQTQVGHFREHGPKALLVRRRTEKEAERTYFDYLLPRVGKVEENASLRQNLSARMGDLFGVNIKGERRSLAPVQGPIDAVDRAFLGKYTARTPYKVLANMVGSSYLLSELFYDPVDVYGKKKNLDNAAVYGLDHEYPYRILRDDIRTGKTNRQEAEKIVRADLQTRRAYFDAVRSTLEKYPEANIETIAPVFLRLLEEPELAMVFGDLRYYLSQEIRHNPVFKWKNMAAPVTEEQYKKLFELNHLKAYGFAILPRWLKSDFDYEKLAQTDPSGFETYKSLMRDPFERLLIAYRDSGRISEEKLEWMSLE